MKKLIIISTLFLTSCLGVEVPVLIGNGFVVTKIEKYDKLSDRYYSSNSINPDNVILVKQASIIAERNLYKIGDTIRLTK